MSVANFALTTECPRLYTLTISLSISFQSINVLICLKNVRALQNSSYKEIKIMDNAVNQFITNCHFCCFEGFAKVSPC